MKKLGILTVGLALAMGLALTTGVAWAAPKKAVFWDSAISPGWANQAESIGKYFEGEGYTMLDSIDLAAFMTKRVADKEPSVIVFAIDKVPMAVVPKATKKCLMREYLDAGGKIVWLCDIPIYYIQDPDATEGVTLGENGAATVLGVPQGGKWDLNEDVTITEEGAKWGLTEVWASMRAIKIYKSSVNLKALATTADGFAAAWVKGYGGPEGTGFVRIFDRGGAPADLAWVKSVAEYGLQ